MQLYKHKSYEEYLTAQIRVNKRKLTNKWVWPREIRKIAKHAKVNIPSIDFVICHGVRNGYEIKKFIQQLGIDNIIGTEISPTAAQFENVIQWDFHNIKSEWIDSADLIYSNSLDHSNSPKYCVDQWMKCLKKSGICYVHWSEKCHNNIKRLDAADCFAATKEEYRELFNNRYCVIDEINIERTKRGQPQKRTIFAIKHERP